MSKTLPKLPGRDRGEQRRSSPGAVFSALADAGRLRTVPITAIEPNPRQPRKRFDDDALQALADSISERGILQPPVVRPVADGRYELIAGERRWRASQLAGLAELDVLVKEADDTDALEDALMENTARADLSPVEEARAYELLIEDLGIARAELGRRVGRSRAAISNHLRLLELPDDALELVDAGELSFAHGRALLLVDGADQRLALARQAVQEGWSTRQLEDAARKAGAPRSQAKQPASGSRRNAPASAAATDTTGLGDALGTAMSEATGVSIDVRVNADEYAFVVHGEDNALALARHLGADVDAAVTAVPPPPS